MDKRYLSVKELTNYTGISAKTLYRWSREGKIPALKISNLLRFDKFAIDNWLNKYKRESINEDLLESA